MWKHNGNGDGNIYPMIMGILKVNVMVMVIVRDMKM